MIIQMKRYGNSILISVLLPLFLACSTTLPDSLENQPSVTAILHDEISISTPSLHPTSTPSPTSTRQLPDVQVLPVPRKEKVEIVRLYLEEDSDCQLPCWWGITPGVTTLNEAVEILSRPATLMEIHRINSMDILFVQVPMPEKYYPQDIYHTYFFDNNLTHSIEINPGYNSKYQISNILNLYGSPSEVWVTTFNQEKMGYTLFSVIIFYPELGILVDHEFKEAYIHGDTIFGCPGEDTSPDLFLFRPGYFNELEEVLSLISPEAYVWLPFQRVDDVSDLTIDKFYSLFNEYGKEDCITTKTDLWPEPN